MNLRGDTFQAGGVAVCMVVMLMVVGCRSALPVHPWEGEATARQQLADEARQRRTMTAETSLRLSRGLTGVTLDGAMAVAMPHHLRLRAWKFDQAVLDVTITSEGRWVFLDSQAAAEGGDDQALQHLADGGGYLLRTLAGEPWGDAGLHVHRETSRRITWEQPLDSGGHIRWSMDKPTRTLREATIYDADNRHRAAITFDHFALLDDTPFPMRWRIRSEHGELSLTLREVIFNEPIAPAALRPARRAEAVP